ncbi:MAG: cytochrome c, partial [Gemmatimonadota bacterium]|nr:cytochrome c [Gemmatimonadota bacterium]
LAGSYPIRLPDYSYGVTDSLVDTIAWDDSTQLTAQNWSREDWQWFSHASQGGAFEVPIPYDWILSLEQPTVALLPNLGVGLLMDQAYLEQFGFIPNPVRWYEPDSLSVRQGYVARYLGRLDPPSAPPVLGLVENNPDRLPVGFARTDDWIDHSTGQMIDVLGFTCAACHTSQIDYYDEAGDRLVRIPIRGGPANVDLGKFRRAVSVSLYLTQLLPGRFDRFAERLEVARGADRRALKEDFDALIDRLREVRVLQRELEIYPTEEGFGRLDAMGRIFNFVFGTDLGDESNLAVADAPVNFPPLWDASRFDWVQYNASFRQPMIRNAGQSMGVFASVDLHGAGEAVAVEDDPVLFASSIDLLNIHDMELLLGGCTLNATNRPELLGEGCRRDFEGLRSPTWPSLFPKIDRELAATGAALYQQHCAVCHLPSPGDSARFSAQAWADPDLAGNSFLALRGSTLQEVRTDPRAAINFAIRSVDLGVLGRRLGIDIDSVSEAAELSPLVDSVLTRSYELLGRELDRRPKGVAAAEALQITVNSVLARRYDDYGIEPALQDILEGHRGPKTRVFLGYRARPLNGVWATAPFLHNGSVPTLYHLLSPQAERPDTFHLGSRLFDPELVGFDFERHDPGFFEFDASLPGNSNYGHSFEGDPQDWRGRPGVLGPELSHQDRMAIIEFLKKLPPLPVRPHDEGG